MRSPGPCRLFYKASGFKEGVTVTAKVFRSDASVFQTCLCFTEMPGEGLYYADLELPVIDRYILVVSENGSRSTMGTIDVGVEPGVVYYRG